MSGSKLTIDYGVMVHSRTEYGRDYEDFLANIGKGLQD
jgi:hypothetical protein